jgi:serine/threonine-protein kinase
MDPTIQPGNVIAGKYTVEAVLGVGGMGMVVRARQSGLDRPVAIKVLLGAFRERKDIVERFYREAKAAARVRSEHVAQVFDVGTTEQGDPYLAMEFLEGEDLDRRLEREGRFPLPAAALYMQQACMGVAEAHAAKIVHRDLKPANLFVAQSSKGRALVKVIDFGISKVEEGPSNLTQTSGAIGTVYYMAPEQIERPKDVDARADIWALGIIFHQFLTGEVPYGGDTMPMVIANVLRNNRVPATQLVPGLPPEVDQIISRCLQPNPDDRFQSAQDLAEAIGALAVDPGSPYLSSRMRVSSDARAPSASVLGSGGSGSGGSGSGSVPDLFVPDRPSAGGRTSASSGGFSASATPTTGALKRNAGIELDGADDSGMLLEIDDPRIRARAASNPQMMQPSSTGPRGGGSNGYGSAGSSPTLVRTDEPVHRSVGQQNRPEGRPVALIGGGIFGAVLVLGLGLVLGVPRIVSSSLQSTLLTSGMGMTHDGARFMGTSVELTGFEGSVAALNGTTVRAKKARVSLSGSELTLKEVELTSVMPLEEVTHVFAASEGSLPKTVRMEDVHIHQALFTGIVLDATGASLLDVADGGGSRTLTLSSPAATLETPVGTFGPFPLSFERGPGKAELVLGSKDGAGAEMTWTASSTELKAHAPRAPYSLPVKALGIFTEDVAELTLDLTASADLSGDVSGKGSIHVFGAKFGPAKADLLWDMDIGGKDNDVWVKTVKASVGPFAGDLRGEWSGSDRKHAYVKFHTATVPCADVAHLRTGHGSSPQVLASLMDYVGVAVPKGEVAASGVVTVNLDSPPRAWASLSKNDTCGLQIFPGK